MTNYAQTEKVLILPKFNIPEDQEAYEQIARLMPNYKDRIEMVDATDVIRYEGCLNCASWTFISTPNLDLPLSGGKLMKTGHLVTEVTGTLLFAFELPRTSTFVWFLLLLLRCSRVQVYLL